jgi:adenylosuccinate lyase
MSSKTTTSTITALTATAAVTLHDTAGVDLRDTEAVEESEKTGTHELCAVVYDVNVLGRVPNFMKVVHYNNTHIQ